MPTKTTKTSAAKPKTAGAAKPRTKTAAPGKPAATSRAKQTATRAKPATAARTKKTATPPVTPPPAPVAEPKVVTTQAPVVSGPALTKKALIEQAVTRSGIKKKYGKPAIEAALAVLGEALAEGREIKLPPLGRGKVTRTQDKANGNVIVLRLRQSSGGEDGTDDTTDDTDDDNTGLAPAAE